MPDRYWFFSYDDFICLEGTSGPGNVPGDLSGKRRVSPGTPTGGTSRVCTMILRQQGFYVTASAGANEVSTRPPAPVEVSQPSVRRLEPQAAAPDEK